MALSCWWRRWSPRAPCPPMAAPARRESAGLPGFESFLGLVRQQVLARATGADGGYGLEAEARRRSVA